MSAFEGCVSLRVAEQRSREDRRERNHSKHQLTWVMSQQDSNTPDDDEEGEEADATAELTANLNLVVSSWSPEFLKELIHDNAGHAHFVLFLQAVFECSKPKSKGGLERLLVAFEATAQALADKPVVRREDVVAELLQQTKLIPERSLAMVTERVLDIALAEHQQELQQVLEILCKLVNCLSFFPQGMLDPDHQCSANLALQDLDGKQFKFLVVRQLCSSKTITEHTLPPLLVALKDLCHNLERDDAKLSALVFERMERNVCAWLKKVRPSQHLGRIALHFFGLSRYFASKDRACRYLMEDFFEQPEEQVPLVVFGQVLMNFSLVCAQDAELGKAFLRELETVPLTRTSLAFLLSLSRIKRFEEASFDLFLRKSKGKAGKPQSPQHQQLLENNLMQLCDDIAACRASSSWELLLPCLVKASTKLADSETTLLPHPNLDLSSNGGVGVRVLAHCFRVHALCRIDLLNEVFKRSLCCPLQQVLPFTRMLFLLMRAEDTNRIILSDYAQLVKDLVSMLPNCQPRVAHGLLRAVFTPHPTASSSSSSSKHKREMQTIRDHSMVVFRKTLFLREPKPRFVAMFGILCLFRQEEDEDALNCLKRCLSQQCEIRAALYAGLLVLPSVCAELIVLSSHFNALLVPRKDGEDVAPLRFQQCLDTNGRIAEPLAGLLQCAIHGGFDPTELIARFCTGSLASFSLDKSCGFDSCVTGGAGNRSTASLVIECCEVLINHLVERRLGTQEEIAKLWRLQRAVRRLVAGNTTGLVSAPKRSKKTKPQKKSLEGAENGDEEEDECGEDGGRLVDAPLPDEGSWLSDRALLMLFAQSQTVAVDSMMQVSPANANELAGLQTRSGFHIYLLQCVKLRLAAVGKLCQTQPAVQSPFASAKLAAATGTGATMMEESGGAYTQDMARRCAGGSEMDVTGFFTHLGPLLLKALPRYEKLQGLIQADISTAAAATVAEKEEPKKKRKVAASSAAATSSSSTAENDGLKLREQAIECLKDLVVCLSKSSSPSPASSEAFAQVITQTFSLQTPAAAKQNVFHLAGIQLFEIVRKLFTQHRLGAALQAFDTYCLLVTRAISWLGEEDKSDAQDTVMDHHVSLCKQLLGEFELKSGAHVKLLVKFYLELNTKLCKGNLSLICSELASHVMLNSSQDHGLKMIVHARLPTLQVLVGHICHAMDELELGFAQVDTCKSTLIQLDEASELFTVFLQRAQDGEAEAFDLDPELLLKAVIKYYKLLAKLFKALVAAKQPVTECAGDVGRLVQKVAKHLSPLVDERLKDLQSGSRASAPAEDSEAPCKPKSRAKKPASSSASRNKLVPEVVFCLEQYEVMVLKASKGCQGSLSALGRFVRRTTARDFKVDLEKLKTALGEQEDEEQEEEEEEA